MKFILNSVEYNLPERVLLMAILNVTPDSFSDGGKYKHIQALDTFLKQCEHDKVDIIDIGGESSRPGAQPVSEEEELNRVLPAIEYISARVSTPISIDTYKASVAEKSLQRGASIVNDISGGCADKQMFKTVAAYNAPYILMHMKGTPRNMQQNPTYTDIIHEMEDFFLNQIKMAEAAGIKQIVLDPGIGFGKTFEHNYYLLNHLSSFLNLEKPLLIGASRKRFLAGEQNYTADQREEQTLVVHTQAILNGARIIRTHNTHMGRKMIDTCQQLLLNR